MAPKKVDPEPLDVSGVAEEWDGCEDVRDRLRAGGSAVHPEAVQDDVQGCSFCFFAFGSPTYPDEPKGMQTPSTDR